MTLKKYCHPSVLINSVLMLLVAYFIASFLKAQWPALRNTQLQVNWFYLFLSLMVFEGYWVCQILNWRHVMRQQGESLSFFTASYFYFISCLLAYIPGKVANFIGMANLAEQQVVSKSKTLTTVFLIQIYALLSALLLIVLACGFLSSAVRAIFMPVWPVILGALIIGLLLLLPVWFHYPKKGIETLLKRSFDMPGLHYRHHLVNILIFAACWMVLALSLSLLLKSVSPDFRVSYYADVLVIFTASYALGLLAITLPAGLGLVETGLSYGYALLCSPTVALVGAFGFRLLSLATIGIGLLFLVIFKSSWQEKSV